MELHTDHFFRRCRFQTCRTFAYRGALKARFWFLTGLFSAVLSLVAQEISINRIGGAAFIEWSGTASLQYTAALDQPWQDLPTGRSPFKVEPSAERTFYRLKLTDPLELGEVVYSIWPDGSVSLAAPLENVSDTVLDAVEVTSVDLSDESSLDLLPLPVLFDSIQPERSGVLRARFTAPVADNQKAYVFTAKGRYSAGGASHDFVVTRELRFGRANVDAVEAKSAPPARKWNVRSADSLFGPAKPAAKEVEFAEAAPIPIGPDVALFPRSTPESHVKGGTTSAGEQFVRINKDSRTGSPTGIPPDPNAAADTRREGNSGVALITYNTIIGVSTDSGANFTTFNPKAIVDPGNPSRTTIFPEDDGGLCCDQLVTYLPQQNIFAWVLQYWPQTNTGVGTGTANRIRVAWATPEAIRTDFINAWSWIDLTSGLLAIGNDWFDQPDVSFSGRFLLVSMSHGLAGTGSVYNQRRMLARVSLSDMLDPAASSVGIGYYEPVRNGLVKTRIIQNSTDAFRWATMDDTSNLYLYEWSDSSGSIPAPANIPITTLGSDFTSTDPSGVQWLVGSSSLGGVRGSTYVNASGTRVYDLAIDSGRQTAVGRPHPYVRIETINQTGATRTVAREFDIWNPAHGFALAELTHGPTGRANPDLAITISAGGGALYPRPCVGFLGDFIVYYVADNNATEASYALNATGGILTDSAGNNIVGARYGDYSSARLSRPAPRANYLFSTLVYDVRTPSPGREACASGNCSTTPHYVEWGRPEDY